MRVDEESRHAVDELGGMRFMHKSLRAPRKQRWEEGEEEEEEARCGVRRFVMPALREDN